MFTQKHGIILKDSQIEPFREASDILQKYHSYIDVSPTGSGKSFLAVSLAFSFKLPIVVACPSASVEVWRKIEREVDGITFIDIVSYETLRAFGQGANFYYKYRYVGGERQAGPSDDWIRICMNGVFLILDEAHGLKNETAQNTALSILTNEIIMHPNSRFGVLSATLFDSDNNSINIARMLGLVGTSKLYDIDEYTGAYTPTGLLELYNVAAYVSKAADKRMDLDDPYTSDKDTAPRIATDYLLYIIGSMQVEIVNTEIERRCYRGFFRVMPNDVEKLDEAMMELRKVSALNSNDNIEGHIDFGAVTRVLRIIEIAEANTMARVAYDWLIQEPECKVIVCVNFIETFEIIMRVMQLNGIPILGFNGSTKTNHRSKIVASFNNDDKYRFLLMTTQTGGQSISLHDLVGNRKRKMLISPSYRMTLLHQATGRIFRMGQKSVGEAYIFYPYSSISIDKVMRALSTKSGIMSKTLKVKRNKYNFPGDYPRYIEGVGYFREDMVADDPTGARNLINMNRQVAYSMDYFSNQHVDMSKWTPSRSTSELEASHSPQTQ